MLATLGGIGQFSFEAVIMALWMLRVLTLPMLERRPLRPPSLPPSSGDGGVGGPNTAGETGETGETAVGGVNAELMCVGGGGPEIIDTDRRLRLGLAEWVVPLDCEGGGGGGAGRGAV